MSAAKEVEEEDKTLAVKMPLSVTIMICQRPIIPYFKFGFTMHL